MLATGVRLCFLVSFLTVGVKTKHDYVRIRACNVTDPFEVTTITKVPLERNLKEIPLLSSFSAIRVKKGLSILREDYVSDLPNLSRFSVSKVREIRPGSFRNVSRLTHIEVTESFFLREIREGVFNGLRVVNLDLSDNKISIIKPRAFDNMPSLEKLNLSFNALTYWDSDWFLDVPSLKSVDFTRNHIRVLPDGAFKFIRNGDAEIILTSNNVNSVGSGLFGRTRRTKMLALSGNKIKNFGEGVLDGLEKIDVLDLSDNRIECFRGNISSIFRAETTNMLGNPLKCLECNKCQKRH